MWSKRRGSIPYTNIAFGTPIQDDATNGEVFMLIFPDAEVEIEGKYITLWLDEYKWLDIDYVLWNAPYKKEVEE